MPLLAGQEALLVDRRHKTHRILQFLVSPFANQPVLFNPTKTPYSNYWFHIFFDI
jgi:hypothetical protein